MSIQTLFTGVLKLFGMVTSIESQNLTYAICIFMAYPLALFYRKFLRSSFLKHCFAIIIGVLFCTNLFQMWDIAHILLSSTLTLLISMYFPLNWKPDILVFVLCLLQLSFLHIYRMWTYWMSWTVDVTGVMMLLTIKMTSFSFDYVEKRKNSIFAQQNSSVFSDEKKSNTEHVNILEWFGYIFFFPSLLTGPTSSFDDYVKYVNEPVDTDAELRQIRKSTFNRSLYLIVVVLLGLRLFPISFLYNDAFAKYSFLNKLLYAYIAMLVIRCKYYFAWTIAKASCLAAGLSQEVSTNIKIYEVEFAQNPREVMSNWNICSSNWLKTHIYSRLVKSGTSTSIATFCTNMVSAFWHGFYPGYYLTFLMGGLLTEVAKGIRRSVRPYFLNGYTLKIYETVATLCTILFVMYFSIPFQVYGLKESFGAWYNLYFFGHIVMAFGGLLILIVPRKVSTKEFVDDKNLVDKSDPVNFVTMSPLSNIEDFVQEPMTEQLAPSLTDCDRQSLTYDGLEQNTQPIETQIEENVNPRLSSKNMVHHLVRNGQKQQNLQVFVRSAEEDKKNL
jgi:lysophospholipid acyltransferase